MSIFSLDWFKSKKQRKLEKLKVKEQKIKNELLMKQLNYVEPVVVKKPYTTLKLVNDTLTVVLLDGSIISKPSATIDDFKAIKLCNTECEIIDICTSQEVLEEKYKLEKEIITVKALQKGIGSLRNFTDEFIVDGNTVYFNGISRSIPQLLLEEILKVIDMNDYVGSDFRQDTEYQALKRFFMWCCLNPRAEVADQLYSFLKENSFRITSQGFFVALRNIVTVRQDSDTELVQFISNAYNKIKAVWKKKPEDYFVIEDGDGEYSLKNTNDAGLVTLGNLKDLYLDLPNMKENRFTDAHTRTFDIRVGRVVNMPPEDCSWSTADCAHAGLHFTSDEIHYVGCGDTSVLILINPMKVVGIGTSKGRCYEYLPIMTVPRDEATKILHDLDFDTLELDEEFAIRELENLSEVAKTGFVAEATKYEFNLPAISTSEMITIIKNLDEMKNELSTRVSNIS